LFARGDKRTPDTVEIQEVSEIPGPMREKLSTLRNDLCRSGSKFCQACFEGGQFADVQNPPNVFRNRPHDSKPYLFFVFDKPNNNDPNRGQGLEPIEILDDRFEGNPTRINTIKLIQILGLADGDKAPLCAKKIHITNAVKCDKCAASGKTGQIEIGREQVSRCHQQYFFKELDILHPKVLVLFGANTDKFITGKAGPSWKLRQEVVNGRTYTVVRVPHTTATPFNTHGKKGLAYKEKLADLWEEVRRA